jgi:alkylation response protein AidB-like acyl-CoA dehydrogenase
MARRPSLAAALWRARRASASRSSWAIRSRSERARCELAGHPLEVHGGDDLVDEADLPGAARADRAAREGGYGVSKEFPLERWYREARVRCIAEGPSEVHRMVIARALFR